MENNTPFEELEGEIVRAVDLKKTFALNLAYTALPVFVVAKMLSSERIMFGK